MPIGPSTVATGYNESTEIEQQRKVFKNPRGLGYYYAFIKAVADNRYYLYKSQNGVDWTQVTGWGGAVNDDYVLSNTQTVAIFEDGTNTRLILLIISYVETAGNLWLQAYYVDDDVSDPDFLWEIIAASRTDENIHNPSICLDDDGYIWVSWVDEYTLKGKQRFDIDTKHTQETYPTSTPTWSTVTEMFGGCILTKNVMDKVEVAPLTATADVGFVYSYYDFNYEKYRLRAKTGMRASPLSGEPEISSLVVISHDIASDMIHSSVAESGANSDVFIGYKDLDGSFKCAKWDVSEASSAAFGTVFSSTVDSLALSINKNADPDILYAFYVKDGVMGDIFYKTRPVDASEEWSSEAKIDDDDDEVLDYLSASYQDWGLDGDVQLIYTRQTSFTVRFACAFEVPPPPPPPPPTSTCSGATWDAFQRKSFYASGLHWIWYVTSQTLVFRSSSDGLDWSDATSIGACLEGEYFSVFFSGGFVHYVRHYDYDTFYRRGTPQSDGSINWSEEQPVHDGSSTDYLTVPMISVDSGGYAWIGARHYVSPNYLPKILKNANNDGTWTTDDGVSYELSGTSSGYWVVLPVPLTSLRVYVIYAYMDSVTWGRLYNGSWGDEEDDLGDYDNYYPYFMSATGKGDDVHFTYHVLSKTHQIRYNKRTYSVGWQESDELVQDDVKDPTASILSIDTATGNLYCFWTGAPTTDHIYYKKRIDGVWDDNPTDWINESGSPLTGDDRITGFHQAYGSHIGLMYMTKTASPYDIKYNFLTIEVMGGLKQLILFSEPPTGGQFNKLSYTTEPLTPGAWNQMKRET